VIEAPGGEEALRLFDEYRDAIDVVLTDVAMPGMSGIELAGRLRRERPALPLIFTSGYSGEETGLPPDGSLVRKLFTADELVTAVVDVLPVSFFGR
jgi:CheY-like chemotaxis protein